mmetsp:Transcript_81507/g.161822  ORF Transcript_81507/g.161822 Transcript_81507/m.161822 type:complete len:120 (+) Transcript_81507:753-1112(+)
MHPARALCFLHARIYIAVSLTNACVLALRADCEFIHGPLCGYSGRGIKPTCQDAKTEDWEWAACGIGNGSWQKAAAAAAAAAGIAVDEVRCCFTCGSTRVMALGTETRVIVVKKEGTPW